VSLNLSWLDDFFALVASGNFSRAAEERHMTQPAFSRRIRALEEWLGTELFDRSSQPARLTAAGEWFRDAAHDLMARVARVPGEARAVAEARSTALRFAATHALSFTFLTGWLQGIESRTTVGSITLVSDVFARCEAMLLESQVQFVMSHSHPQASSELVVQGFPFVRVGSDLLIPVSAPDATGRPRHALADAAGACGVVLRTFGQMEVDEIANAAGNLERELNGTGRLLLRYSGTENLARVMIEGKEQNTIERQADDLAAVIQTALG